MKKPRYFSSFTPKQKDEIQKNVCSILSFIDKKYIPPSLWGVLFNISFDEIMDTKKESDKYTKGKCIYLKNNWVPLLLIEHIKNHKK